MNHLKSFFLLFFSLIICIANSQIFFSEYAEGSSYNKYLEIYNYSSSTVDLSLYAFPSCSNGCDDDTEWDYMNYFPDGAIILPGDVYVIAHPNVVNPDGDYYTEEIAIYSDHQFTYLSNGNDVFALIEVDTGLILDIIGAQGPNPGDGWDVAGVTNATKDHTLLRKSSVLTGNNGNWTASAGTNPDNSEWIVLDNNTWDNLGFHNYENNSITLGCMDNSACNFNENANQDDGSCEYIIDCLGNCGGLAYFDDCGNCDIDSTNDCMQDVTGCYWCEFAANYFDFNPQNTGNNMSILINPFDDLVIGDVIGAFYVDQNGYLGCGGSLTWSGDTNSMAVWGAESGQNNGFQSGDNFIFMIFRDGVVYETEITLSQESPFTNIYQLNGFGFISSLSITGEFIEMCELPLGIGDDCSENNFSISDNEKNNKKVILISDLNGKRLKEILAPQLYFITYNDGTVERKYFLSH